DRRRSAPAKGGSVACLATTGLCEAERSKAINSVNGGEQSARPSFEDGASGRGKRVMSDLSILAQLELGNGLFLAAPGGDYERVWIRDNVYVAEGFEALGDWTTTRRIYWGLLNILHRHSWKIDWALWQRPRSGFEYIHPRYDVTGVEIADPWGFKQHDAIGILLYKIASLEKAGLGILRSHADLHLMQKLVWYLDRIEYWQDPDSGMWEE